MFCAQHYLRLYRTPMAGAEKQGRDRLCADVVVIGLYLAIDESRRCRLRLIVIRLRELGVARNSAFLALRVAQAAEAMKPQRSFKLTPQTHAITAASPWAPQCLDLA